MKLSGKIKTVFFGSGPVAAESLKLLVHNFQIEAVITKPRAAHHNGSVPVIEVCEKYNVPFYTANNRQALDDLISAQNFKSHVALLVDFGIIVSKKVINAFPRGIINSHFSLLPKLRGADPISFAILQGEQKTGVSLMLIDEGIDTGKLLAQRTYRLPNDITAPELTKQLILLSNTLLCEYVPRYINGEIKPRQQPHPNRASYTRKLSKTDGYIDWHKSASELEREIRAFIGWPGSRTFLFGTDVIITKAHVHNGSGAVGAISIDKSSGLIIVCCGSGSLAIERLKPAGKREMSAHEFITGYSKNYS